jgi:hypothetical protein
MQTHRPVAFRADFPLLQVQPLPRQAYAEQTLSATNLVPDMAALCDNDWDAYRQSVVLPSQDPSRDAGAYAVACRKRRRNVCPASVVRAA